MSLSSDFYQACMAGDIAFILSYLKENSNLDLNLEDEDSQYPMTPLENACSRDRVEVMKLLIECGADPHHNLEHPLRIAAANGFLRATTLLLQYEPNIHVRYDLPLFLAANSESLAVVKELVYAGANLDVFRKDESRSLEHLRNSDVMSFLVSIQPVHDLLRAAKIPERLFREAYRSETLLEQVVDDQCRPSQIRDFLHLPKETLKPTQHEIIITKELLEIASDPENIESVRYLLKTTTLEDEAAAFAYHLGLQYQQPEVIELAKSHGVDSLVTGFEELLLAIEDNNVWAAEYLVYSESVDPSIHGFAGPRRAIQLGRSEMLQMFIRAGVSADGFLTESAVRKLIRNEQFDILDGLIRQCSEASVRWRFILQYAIELRKYRYAERLLENDIVPSSVYGEHMYELLRERQFDLIRLLMSRGANWKPLFGLKTGDTELDNYLRALEALDEQMTAEMQTVIQLAARSTDIREAIINRKMTVEKLQQFASKLESSQS